MEERQAELWSGTMAVTCDVANISVMSTLVESREGGQRGVIMISTVLGEKILLIYHLILLIEIAPPGHCIGVCALLLVTCLLVLGMFTPPRG